MQWPCYGGENLGIIKMNVRMSGLGMKDELETRSYVRRFLFLLHFGRCSIICCLQTYSTVKSSYCAIRNTSYHIFYKKIHEIGTISVIYLNLLNFKFFHFFILFFIRAIFKLYIYIPTNCTQLIYFINNTLKHMYCLKL